LEDLRVEDDTKTLRSLKNGEPIGNTITSGFVRAQKIYAVVQVEAANQKNKNRGNELV